MLRRYLPFLLALGATAYPQPSGPAFDAASVKLAEDATFPAPFNRTGGRITWTTSRLGLICRAFDVPAHLVTGLDSSRLFIALQAVTDPAATDAQVRLMLQRLLAERFQLAVHREVQDRPVLALVIAKGGPKMKPVQPDEKVSPPPSGFFKGVTPPEGNVAQYVTNNHAALIGRRAPMDKLAVALVAPAHAIVVNQTGLTGAFDLDVNYSEEGTISENASLPSIFEALPEQLGLRLEKRVAPLEFLVVDHMEKKPTAN